MWPVLLCVALLFAGCRAAPPHDTSPAPGPPQLDQPPPARARADNQAQQPAPSAIKVAPNRVSNLLSPPPVPDRRVTKLPKVATGWTPPSLVVERGRCWVRLGALSNAQLGLARREFEERNPGWRVDRFGVDPFTGYITMAHYLRREVGHAVSLPQAEYERRRLAPLRANADLIAMTARDLATLQWEAGEFKASTTTLIGSAPSARTPHRDDGVEGLMQPGFSVLVRFQRDGIVSGFTITRLGPPLAFCTTPQIDANGARRSPGITNADARPESLQTFARGFVVTPDEVGDARLTLDRWVDRGKLSTNPVRSVTWRLVWAVDVRKGMWTFLIDAVTGDTIGLRKNFMT